MKKIYKKTLAAVLALILLLSLSGCGALEDMRSQQAYLIGYDTVIWNGETYRGLPACDYLSPQMDYSTTLYGTAEDVPVLLSTTFYLESLDVSTDGNFLVSYQEDNKIYCKENLYYDLCQRIKEPFVPDMVYYKYSVYNEAAGKFEDRYYKLTQEQLSVIEQIIAQVEPSATGDDVWEKADITWDLTLRQSSQDMLLSRDYIDICSNKEGYLLLVHTDGQALYAVPKEYDHVIYEIVSEFKINNGFDLDYQVLQTIK